jgi:pyroglutamyl-peptidase
MKLLLTGFEPFGDSPINPSEQVVRALAAEELPGVTLTTAVLPVDRARGPAALLDAFDRAHPDAVICLGLAARRASLAIERVAVNLLDYPLADNAGRQVVDEPIIPGGPAAYFATLPVRALCQAAHAAGVPAELSLSAGTFLCNQVMYTLLHHIAADGQDVQAGFIHLPYLPIQAVTARGNPPSMALDTMLTGLRAMIGTLASPRA